MPNLTGLSTHAQLTQLDQCMRNYGPGSELVRRQLQSFTATAKASNWRSEAAPPGVSYPDVSKISRDGARQVLTDLMNRIGLEIRQLRLVLRRAVFGLRAARTLHRSK